MGIETVGDLAAQPRHRIEAGIGKAAGAHIHALSHGRDDRPVVVGQELKSIGHEEKTARHDIRSPTGESANQTRGLYFWEWPVPILELCAAWLGID